MQLEQEKNVLLLRDDLLNPLPADSQSPSARQLPFYDKLKEARKEDEDETNPGQWQHARKKADFAVVLKTAGDALATKTKDLELAVWFSEALIRKEGFAALPPCLNLLLELQERFWECLYPQLDDGSPDLEFRATHLRWFASRCDYLLRRTPLTKKGLGWFTYYDSTDTSRERRAMAGEGPDDQKREERDKAVAAREAAAAEFSEAFNATPKSFYVTAFGQLEAGQEGLSALEAFCDGKYGQNFAPNFSQLRSVLEEIKDAVGSLLDKKRETEPDEVPKSDAVVQAEVHDEPAPVPVKASLADPPSIVSKQPVSSAKLTTTEQAYEVVIQVAEFLRAQDRSSVTPYLLVRSLRWGELRSSGMEASQLEAPPTEIRQKLKQLLNNGDWDELISSAEAAAALPCGRAWLDLHRYVCHALTERGYGTVAKAICSELRALIEDLPSLPDSLLNDDTPAANPETREWLTKEVIVQKNEKDVESLPNITLIHTEEQSVAEAGSNGSADVFETALELARSHRFSEAMDALARQPLREHSGREKFLRRLQISQLCLATGQFSIAYPILHDLFSEIEARKLLEWENSSFIVQPLSLLVRCIDKTSQGTEQRSHIYNLVCRLEPAEALKLQSL